MSPLVQLSLAVAATAAAFATFGTVRRVMRAPSTPAWFDNAVMAYALALILTMAFSGTLIAVAMALLRYSPNVVLCGLLSAGIHLVVWLIIKFLIPLPNDVEGRGSPRPVFIPRTVTPTV